MTRGGQAARRSVSNGLDRYRTVDGTINREAIPIVVVVTSGVDTNRRALVMTIPTYVVSGLTVTDYCS